MALLALRKPASVRALRKSIRFLKSTFTDDITLGKSPEFETFAILSYMWDIYVQRPTSFNRFMDENQETFLVVLETLYRADAGGSLKDKRIHHNIQTLLFPMFEEFNKRARLLGIDPNRRFRSRRA